MYQKSSSPSMAVPPRRRARRGYSPRRGHRWPVETGPRVECADRRRVRHGGGCQRHGHGDPGERSRNHRRGCGSRAKAASAVRAADRRKLWPPGRRNRQGCRGLAGGSHRDRHARRRGLKRLAMGSDAELVLRLSSVPVLMVRGEAREPRPPQPDEDRGGRGTRWGVPSRQLVPVGLGKGSPVSLVRAPRSAAPRTVRRSWHS